MKQRLATALIAVAPMAFGTQAAAQVYVGESTAGSGAIVLSNHASDEASVMLLPPETAAPEPRTSTAPSVTRPRALPSKEMRALIDSVAAEVRVAPQLLHAVVAAESNFDPRAVSPKGALGLMQIMPATAQRFGAKDPLQPAQNLRAGALYLKWLAGLFNDDLRLVLAAYNAGEQAVLKAGRKVPDYPETRAYVPRVLAALRCTGVASCSDS